jgi:hypothetical protein
MTANEHVGVPLPQGTPVQVRDHFELRFRSGFEVSGTTSDGYKLRRRSDGVELPVAFPHSAVRPESGSPSWR